MRIDPRPVTHQWNTSTDIHVCVLFTEFTLIFMFVYYSLNSHWYLCLCIIHWIHTDIHVCVLFIEFTLIIMFVCYSLNSDWYSCFSIICWIQTDIHVCVLFTEFIDIHVFKNIIHWIQTDINVCLLTDIHGFFLLFIEFTLIFMFLYYSLNSQWYSCFWGGFSIIHWIQTGVHVFVLQLFTEFTLIFMFVYYSLYSPWYSCLCIIHCIHPDIRVCPRFGLRWWDARRAGGPRARGGLHGALGRPHRQRQPAVCTRLARVLLVRPALPAAHQVEWGHFHGRLLCLQCSTRWRPVPGVSGWPGTGESTDNATSI